MAPFSQRHCVPCEAGTAPLSEEAVFGMLNSVQGWEYLDGKLVRKFRFRDFRSAMLFVNRVADLAEAEGHHPDILISWNRVRLELVTHAIKGLSDNDFIMAARIAELPT